MEVTKQDAPVHIAVQEGSGEEATELGGGGGAGGHLQGIQRLWAPPGYGDLILIPGAGDIGSGRQLSVGGQELVTGDGSVEEDAKNPQQLGGECSSFSLNPCRRRCCFSTRRSDLSTSV